jgi:hypothetical protein
MSIKYPKYLDYVHNKIYVRVVERECKEKRDRKKRDREKRPDPTPTVQAVRKLNEDRRKKELRMLMENNFYNKGQLIDIHHDYDYVDSDDKTAKKRIKAFHAKMRILYKMKNVVYKWIFTTTTTGEHIHHHMMIPNGVDVEEIQSCWKWGYINAKELYTPDDYSELAGYFIKQNHIEGEEWPPDHTRHYTTSRNIIRPEKDIETIPPSEFYSNDFDKEGYDVTELKKYINPITGRMSIEYILVPNKDYKPENEKPLKQTQARAPVKRTRAERDGYSKYLKEHATYQDQLDIWRWSAENILSHNEYQNVAAGT